MRRKKENQTLNDLIGINPKFEITREEAYEVMDKMVKKYGEYSRKSQNKFLEERGFAVIDWSSYSFGRIKSMVLFEPNEVSGKKGFKEHLYFSEVPAEFWLRIFDQCDALCAKKEYAEKMNDLELAKIAKQP